MQRSNVETYATIIREIGEDDGMGTLVPTDIYDVLYRYANLMPEELSKVLPPRRAFDHHIELELGKKPPAKTPYHLSRPELEELKNQLKELVDVGFIRPSRTPYGSPVLFQKKDTSEFQMCCDHYVLKKKTVKKKYRLLLVVDFFDKLVKAQMFSKLDFMHGYYQLWLTEGNEKKTTIVTRHGSFEFLIMPFGPFSAPATFCTLMNNVLCPYLDSFVVACLDNIVVYINNMEDHKRHLALVFEALRKNRLFLKKSKCMFSQFEISFLRHLIG